MCVDWWSHAKAEWLLMATIQKKRSMMNVRIECVTAEERATAEVFFFFSFRFRWDSRFNINATYVKSNLAFMFQLQIP